MCGIAGYISLDNSIDPQQLKIASNLLKHRGPDADGFYFSQDNKIGLAHRRLSIIDLSAEANQPMFSVSGRYSIIFNGEIYNFKELKENLKDKGAQLKTTSDTEVILELFAQHGTKIFEWLNGMFALAIYDNKENILTIARDQVGIKPLFYYCDNDNFIFGSELKVIKSIKDKQLTINESAIPYFLHLGYIPHPLTIYNDTSKFPAGSYWQINIAKGSFAKRRPEIITFWAPENKITENVVIDETSAKKTLSDLLDDSIKKQLISDVPIGTFLSGGIDSSLVTAIASKHTAGKIKTFSIAIDDGKYNESKYAEAVAKKLNTEHHEFHVKSEEVLGLVDTLTVAYDEPYADSSAFPTMLVSKLARKHVTVTLSGDGGDELFMGYGAYQWAKRLSNPLMPLAKWPLYGVSKLMNQRLQRAGEMFAYPDKESLTSHIFSTEQYFFNQKDLNQLLVKPSFDFYDLNKIETDGRKLTAFEKQSLWDLKSYLKDELLVKVDRASMQYSLETRVPILDYRIVEFSLNLHHSLKLNKGVSKYLLKEVLYDYLPKELFNRPKRGFSIPLEKWLRKELNHLVEKYTSKAVINKYNYVDYNVVANLKKLYYNGKDYLYGRIWLIMILHWWLENNSDG